MFCPNKLSELVGACVGALLGALEGLSDGELVADSVNSNMGCSDGERAFEGVKVKYDELFTSATSKTTKTTRAIPNVRIRAKSIEAFSEQMNQPFRSTTLQTNYFLDLCA